MIWIAPCISQVNSTLRHLLVLCFHQSCFVAPPTSFFFSLLPPTQSERRLKLLFHPTTNSHHPNGQPLIIVNKRRAGGTSSASDPSLSHFNLTLGCVSFPSQLSTDSGACPADCSAGAEYITREAVEQGKPAYLYFWGPKSDCRNCWRQFPYFSEAASASVAAAPLVGAS